MPLHIFLNMLTVLVTKGSKNSDFVGNIFVDLVWIFVSVENLDGVPLGLEKVRNVVTGNWFSEAKEIDSISFASLNQFPVLHSPRWSTPGLEVQFLSFSQDQRKVGQWVWRILY